VSSINSLSSIYFCQRQDTLVKQSSSISIKCIKQTAENISPCSNHVVCWHEVEGKQCKCNPNITYTVARTNSSIHTVVQIKAWGYAYVSLKIEYVYDTFRTLYINSIHPADLWETYVYPFTPVQLYRSMTRWGIIASWNLIKLTILHYKVGQ